MAGTVYSPAALSRGPGLLGQDGVGVFSPSVGVRGTKKRRRGTCIAGDFFKKISLLIPCSVASGLKLLRHGLVFRASYPVISKFP